MSLTVDDSHTRGLFSALEAALRPFDLHATSTDDAYARAHRAIDGLEDTLRDIRRSGDSSPVVSKAASVHPTAVIGSHVVAFPGAHVGPYCFVRGSTILFPGSWLGYLVETDFCVIFNDVQVHHSAVLGQSIIGSRGNLAFGFATATRRLDGEPVQFGRYGSREVSPSTHHGAVLGQGVVAGVHSATMPGASVAPATLIPPHAMVSGFDRGAD